MRNYIYEYATEKDGVEIAALLEDTEFKGGISIAYCRRPNAVLSLSRDGEKSTFVIARNSEGKIVGVGGCTINGDTAYLTGLRAVVPTNIPKAYQMIHDFCVQNDVKMTYTTILEDNIEAQKMLEKKRARMPQAMRHSVLVLIFDISRYFDDALLSIIKTLISPTEVISLFMVYIPIFCVQPHLCGVA